MESIIEQTLYVDTQAEKPGGVCGVCGGSLYRPGLRCLRCQRRAGL